MKWIHPAWKVLGIEPTSDTRAIRVAYSAKLKAIDPEQDPKAFIALREAFEAAKAQSQWVDLPDADEDTDEAWGEDGYDEDPADTQLPAGDLFRSGVPEYVAKPAPPDPAWQSPAPPEPLPEPLSDRGWEIPKPPPPPGATPPEPPRPSPWAPVAAEDADSHARALAMLLHRHGRDAQPWPTAAEEGEMLAHWRAVAADPRLQEVSYFGDAERWFSELIARTAPFSDPLVSPATEFFGWINSDGTIGQNPAVAYVTRRYRMLEFQRDVKRPQHPLNPAWRELVRPAGSGPRKGSVAKRKVRELLSIVRAHYPDLEGCFDAERVAMWDGTAIRAGIGWSWLGPSLFFGFVLIRFFANLSPAPNTLPPPVPVPQLSSPVSDLDDALQDIFGPKMLDMATLQKRNPKLQQALMVYWAEELQRRVSLQELQPDVRIFLTQWYYDGVRKGGAALLADYHRLSIDMAKALQADPTACREFLYGDRLWTERLTLPAAFRDRQTALIARSALETDGSTPYKGGEARVPGDLVAAAAARGHLDHAAMSAALVFKGSNANQCAGRIAFMETVLTLPPTRALPLMRVM